MHLSKMHLVALVNGKVEECAFLMWFPLSQQIDILLTVYYSIPMRHWFFIRLDRYSYCIVYFLFFYRSFVESLCFAPCRYDLLSVITLRFGIFIKLESDVYCLDSYLHVFDLLWGVNFRLLWYAGLMLFLSYNVCVPPFWGYRFRINLGCFLVVVKVEIKS